MRPLLLGLLLALGGCTSEQLWHAGQNWQRNECRREPSRELMQRCLERVERWPERPAHRPAWP